MAFELMDESTNYSAKHFRRNIWYCSFEKAVFCNVCSLFLSMENGDKMNVLAQFQAESGDNAGPPIELPIALARDKLQQILNALLQQV